MYNLLNHVRNELFEEFVDILDIISLESLCLYDKITDNLITILRGRLRRPRCGDKFSV